MFDSQIVPAALGTVREAVRLGGMGGGEAYRVALEREHIIAKKINHVVEVYFYEEVAPELRRLDLATPKLLSHVRHCDATWLLLEAAPAKMNRQYLARLHSIRAHSYQLKPVLFDWERTGTGSPALDLATLVPGFPLWRLSSRSLAPTRLRYGTTRRTLTHSHGA